MIVLYLWLALTVPIGDSGAEEYTCTTDIECEQECVALGYTDCWY